MTSRILIVGDGNAPTGFARVMHNVFGHLHGRYDVHHLAINYDGGAHELPWTLYEAGAGGDAFGLGRLRGLIEDVRPELVFVLNDVWTIGAYAKRIREADPTVPIIAYCPIEAGPVDPLHLRESARADRFVVYTEYARREVEQAAAQLRAERPGSRFPTVEVIPHGVDTRTFYPLPDAKRLLFGNDDGLTDSFIVLNANRNQPRKRIDLTIQGFALFARDKPPSVRLYLHMGTEDQGWDVIRLARRHGVEHRLIMTDRAKTIPWVADEQLNVIYNACDVGINSAATEGWGLVSFEHGATGHAQIVPGHGACGELWAGAAELLASEFTLTAPLSLLEEKLIAPGEVARALERLYRDPALRQRRAAEAYTNATREEYRWNVIADRWDALFRQLLCRQEAMGTH